VRILLSFLKILPFPEIYANNFNLEVSGANLRLLLRHTVIWDQKDTNYPSLAKGTLELKVNFVSVLYTNEHRTMQNNEADPSSDDSPSENKGTCNYIRRILHDYHNRQYLANKLKLIQQIYQVFCFCLTLHQKSQMLPPLLRRRKQKPNDTKRSELVQTARDFMRDAITRGNVLATFFSTNTRPCKRCAQNGLSSTCMDIPRKRRMSRTYTEVWETRYNNGNTGSSTTTTHTVSGSSHIMTPNAWGTSPAFSKPPMLGRPMIAHPVATMATIPGMPPVTSPFDPNLLLTAIVNPSEERPSLKHSHNYPEFGGNYYST
jgi:hypothetical protein